MAVSRIVAASRAEAPGNGTELPAARACGEGLRTDGGRRFCRKQGLTLGAPELGATRWDPLVVDVVVRVAGRAGGSHEIPWQEARTWAGEMSARAPVANGEVNRAGNFIKEGGRLNSDSALPLSRCF